MEKEGGDEDEPTCWLRIASRLFAYSKGNMKTTDTMKVAGYKSPERKGGTIHQCVRRAWETMILCPQ